MYAPCRPNPCARDQNTHVHKMIDDAARAQIEALDVFRIAAETDNGGRPIVIFIPAHLPEGDADLLERATLYAFAKLHQLVIVEKREYSAMWLCNNRETPSALPLSWWRRTYYATPFCYQTQLHTLMVVHPTIAVRTKLFVLSYLHSAYLTRHQFWDKVDFADRIEFLDSHVPLALVKKLPDEVKQHDKELDREMYATLQEGGSLEQMHTRYGGTLGGLGAGLGGLGSMGGAMRGHGLDSASFGDGGRSRVDAELPKRNWED